MIDEIDQKIIMELEQDGRVSYSKIAQNLGLNLSTVTRRVARLRTENIILITAVPNFKEMAFMTSAMIVINAEPGKVEAVCDELAKYANIYYTALVFGRFDIVAACYFPSTDELVEFLQKELPKIAGVRTTETLFVAKIKKRTFGWLHKAPTALP